MFGLFLAGIVIIIVLMIVGTKNNAIAKSQRTIYLESLQDGNVDKPKNLHCPKCREPMILGFIPDKEEYGYCMSNWVEGLPLRTEHNVKNRMETSLPVGAYRCSGCGYLVFFARADFMPKKPN